MGSTVNPQLWRLIQQGSRRFNLDPRAVAAVSIMEGGGRFGAVGDNGTSFGPWQLHVGGALPRGKGAQFANSRQGVMYALRHMAQAGAAGKSGQAAINAIVRNFERPADPGSEVAGAWSHYRGLAPGGGGPGPSGSGRGAFGPNLAANARRQSSVQQLISNNWQFATTGRIDPLLQQSAMQNGLTNADQARLGNVRAPRGGALPGNVGQILHAAGQQVGQPYVWGGESRKEGGFDCSGLIQYAYAKAGVHIPRTTYEQIKVGKKVGWGSFKPGDLIFSDFSGSGKPTHVVMYVGNGKVIAAPKTGDRVKYEDVSLFRNYFMGARRILGG